MDGLHRGDDLQVRQASGILRVQELYVLDTVPQRRKSPVSFELPELLERIQDGVVCTVTDGMHGHTQPC